jgi:hypothetical protein
MFISLLTTGSGCSIGAEVAMYNPFPDTATANPKALPFVLGDAMNSVPIDHHPFMMHIII